MDDAKKRLWQCQFSPTQLKRPQPPATSVPRAYEVNNPLTFGVFIVFLYHDRYYSVNFLKPNWNIHNRLQLLFQGHAMYTTPHRPGIPCLVSP